MSAQSKEPDPKQPDAQKTDLEKSKRKRGRPTSFKPQYTEKIMELSKSGCTDAQIALLLGVTERTVNSWKRSHNEFFQSIRRAKFLLDLDVVYSLYRAAKQGNVQAIQFWLKNRMPDEWRDKTTREISGKVEMSVEQLMESMADVSDEQIREEKETLGKAIAIMKRHEPSKLVN